MRQEVHDGKQSSRYYSPMQRIAIYDMDRTITRAPTFGSFLLHAARKRHPWRLLLLPAVGATSALYGLGLIDRVKLKVLNQSLMVGRAVAPTDLAPVVDSFAEKMVATNVLADARRRIERDRGDGYRIVMATASYRLYAEAIARAVGFDDTIATNTLVGLDTRILAQVSGENCYGPAKLRMIEAWMHDQGISRDGAHVRFYSDHVSDAPVFAWADEQFAVNAHGPLRTLAKARGWTLLNWR